MTTIGYIGLDHHHCRPYLQSIEQLDATVTSVAEPSGQPTPDAFDDLGDVAFYEDPEALLAANAVDVAWITLSNRDTPGVIQTALEHDIGVFTEKPVAQTAADLEPVLRTADESSATVGVSYAWRGHPISRKLRERAADGFFGDVDAFDARFVASRLAARDTDHYLFEQAASRGGIVQWLGVHWLDLVPWILDDPVVRVNAQMNANTPSVDIEDGATLQLETASGALGSLTCGYYLREGRYDTHISIYGSGGRSEWDPMGAEFGFDDETTLELDSSEPAWGATPHRSVTYEYEPTPGYGGEWGLDFFEAYLDARSSGGDPPATLDDAHEVLRVLDAAYESAATDGWVVVEPA